ncbi:MAG TPA: hypothetical protein VHF23_00935 [Gaiellaceae bacterium]|jgi:hypothetical protein|nr:hypothetical protein [Gaiellaceae bacterium]
MDPTFAYLDPGTGSMLLQVIVGGAAAVAVTAKLYWRRVRDFVRGGRGRAEEERREG